MDKQTIFVSSLLFQETMLTVTMMNSLTVMPRIITSSNLMKMNKIKSQMKKRMIMKAVSVVNI